MAQKKKSSASKLKKRNSTIGVVVTCLVIFTILFIGITVASDNNTADSPEISNSEIQKTTENTSLNKEATENNTENSETHTSTTVPEITTEEKTTEETTEKSTTETSTVKPVLTGSFYDTVKYRSPDAVPADIFKHGRNLMLLNRQYELPEDFKWDLVYWSNGQYVDALYLNCEEHNSVKAVDRAAYQPLKDMFADAEEAGVPLQLVSAYRSIHLQDKLFTRSVNSYMSQGYSEAEAINKANYSRTFSGTSEHNTGLGFDILEKGNFTLTTSFENTDQFRWLMENAENYGFILRYAEDKTTKTGIMYEPWHFRYVGIEHAKEINRLGMCLEEYIEYLEA
ncbi:MAG: M15 family metallopeptidase [Clostridia bacterium]|nr:M15 family metallopeptidase [Clostridia bacterium]